MSETIIVATDLGAFKAYRLEHTRMNTPRLDLIEELELVDGHGKLGDKVTDQAGRHRAPTLPGAMSYGERQKIGLELRRRLIKQVADHLRRVVNDPVVERCYFAASQEINEQILDEAGPEVRQKIGKNVGCNLTKVAKAELLRHFGEPASAP
ncbi:MAG: host attachment protein [Verrucomicrobia subdivision 3 bacterium]|nr:host attachment protein [Limisphaerales bacterium]